MIECLIGYYLLGWLMLFVYLLLFHDDSYNSFSKFLLLTLFLPQTLTIAVPLLAIEYFKTLKKNKIESKWE